MAIYNLEERTLDFAKRVRNFVKQIPKNVITIEDTKQLIRSSGSVGANYIEANEAVSKKTLPFESKLLERKPRKADTG